MNKNILKRKTLIDIIENQSGKHNYYVIEMYAVLQLLKKEIEKYEYYEDKRFMPELINGEYKERQFFLKEEAERRIEADDVLFAYKNLVELISAYNPCLYYPNLPRGAYKEASDKDRHEEYYKDGYICEKEKNIIMEMITSIEKYCCEKYEIKNGNIEINYLKIGEIKFNLKENTSNLRIKYDSEDLIIINVNVYFEDGLYNELNASPHIEINNIKTSGNKIADLKGVKFEINDINDSYDRGDSFYLYESEPFLQYKLEILENDGQNAHIKLQGMCITDGYSKPYKTENFTVDAIVRIEIYNSEKTIGAKKIITNSNNDEKYVNFFMFVLLGIISGYCLFRSIYQFLPLLFTVFLLLSTVFCWYKAFKIYRSIALNKNFVKRKKTHNKNNNEITEKENNNVIKMGNQKNPISKSVKDMLSEDTYNKLKKLYIGELDIIFFERENIDAGQIGFRYTGVFNEIEEIIDEWPGNEYVIIGYDSTAGCGPDPYIMKTNEKELPIYWLMTDGGNWKNPDKIANSFNDFIKIIDCINKNLNSKNQLNKELILNEISKINLNENMEYWKSLLENDIESNY